MIKKLNWNTFSLIKGDLLPLLNYIKSDDELRLEVRQKGDAFVYYRKGKALEIKKLKVDQKYGNVPSTELLIFIHTFCVRKEQSTVLLTT